MNHHGRRKVLCTATLRTYPYLAFLSAAPALPLVVTCHLRRRHHVRVPEYRLSGVPLPTDELAPIFTSRTSTESSLCLIYKGFQLFVRRKSGLGTRDSGSGAETTKLRDEHVKRPGRHLRQGEYGFRAQKIAVSEILHLTLSHDGSLGNMSFNACKDGMEMTPHGR